MGASLATATMVAVTPTQAHATGWFWDRIKPKAQNFTNALRCMYLWQCNNTYQRYTPPKPTPTPQPTPHPYTSTTGGSSGDYRSPNRHGKGWSWSTSTTSTSSGGHSSGGSTSGGSTSGGSTSGGSTSGGSTSGGGSSSGGTDVPAPGGMLLFGFAAAAALGGRRWKKFSKAD